MGGLWRHENVIDPFSEYPSWETDNKLFYGLTGAMATNLSQLLF